MTRDDENAAIVRYAKRLADTDVSLWTDKDVEFADIVARNIERRKKR